MPFEQFSKAAKQRREYVDALLHDLSEVQRYRKAVAVAYEDLSVKPNTK